MSNLINGRTTRITLESGSALPLCYTDVMNMCRQRVNTSVVILTVLNYCSGLVILMPSSLWSPVTQLAMRRTGDWQLQRFSKLPIIMVVPVLTQLYIEATPVTYATCIIEFLMLFFVICLFVYLNFRLVPAPYWRQPGAQPHDDEHCVREQHSTWKSVKHLLTTIILTQNGGVRVHRELYCMFALAIFGASETYTWGDTAAQWAVRLVAVLWILLVRDKEADFSVLEEHGASFGLVVDARDLFRAISYRLRHQRPYPKRLRLYAASFQRMQETMAISYRWQDKEELIADDVCLNMSTWQLQMLVDSIAQSSCRCGSQQPSWQITACSCLDSTSHSKWPVPSLPFSLPLPEFQSHCLCVCVLCVYQSQTLASLVDLSTAYRPAGRGCPSSPFVIFDDRGAGLGSVLSWPLSNAETQDCSACADASVADVL